jgi:hypothetical protein
LHAIVTLALGLYAGAGSSLRFDGLPAPRGSAAAGMAAEILMSPGYLLWTTWIRANVPNAVEWLVYVANSALWGFLFSIAIAMISAQRLRANRSRPGAG